ncbi:N-hydroxycinnamoyl/benzoyltransferase-like protein [Hirschfeldia incana]|nr:N-hydroxycinnamoyl/benzoyltransferase-like protein [Hirschfeldia incana]
MVSSSSSSSLSEVQIVTECFIKPKTLPKKSKEPYHLSALDHLMLSVHYIQKGLLFLKPSQQSGNDATEPINDFMDTFLQRLKDSLATTLVHFYPLAGRLSTLRTDNPRSHSVFVDCNNSPGAGFIHAKSDLTVADIVGSKHVPLVVQSFFDHHKAVNLDGQTISLLSVKVTELVDGVFIGLSMNHSIGDGSSFWQFFNSLSYIFSSHEEDTIDTNNNNSLFCLKNPPIFREATGPICTLPFSPLDESITRSESPVFKERIFHFSSETVRSLKSMANQDCGTTMISSLQSLTAFIWRSITRARKAPNDQETTCRFAAGNRSRLSPPLPTNHFGVYISVTSTTARTCNLLENGLGWAALKLHRAVTEHSGEKIASGINRWLKSPYVLQPERVSDPNLVHMGSSPRFDKYGCEFGMGKAVAVRSGCNGKYDGKVSAYPGRDGGGSIDLEVCLLPEFMEALESDQEFMSFVSSSS